MDEHTERQTVTLATLPNLRDLGGWITADRRRVRSGVVFRSTELDRLDDTDREAFTGLGIRTIYDLRTAAERSAAPDPTFDGVDDIHLDVLADQGDAVPANLPSLLHDPAAVASIDDSLGDGRAAALIADTYRSLVSTDSALTSYRALFRGLLGDHPGPSLFHCTTGKDRTGWAAATFLSILGVSRDDVYRDYLLTNEQLLPALEPVFVEFAAAGGDRSVLRALLGVDRSYLDAAFAEADTAFGGMSEYVHDGLDLSATDVQDLRRDHLVGA
ncbi:tyrosine-protein phosphatase [Gordonia sp. OPL2]|uniref:tyrosine-protein phosphatase n=1 Tax=Gordonia sp. OPL2 TaxID=2486274 RepID=UPI0016555792|nr:tyrosine-protein phosphatase [Gordonia sp. OPL2]ROZ93719.1 tyrosine-protein phosphatase [Gordonia sp. OPL2]